MLSEMPDIVSNNRFHDGLCLFQFDTIGTKFGTFGINDLVQSTERVGANEKVPK